MSEWPYDVAPVAKRSARLQSQRASAPFFSRIRTKPFDWSDIQIGFMCIRSMWARQKERLNVNCCCSAGRHRISSLINFGQIFFKLTTFVQKYPSLEICKWVASFTWIHLKPHDKVQNGRRKMQKAASTFSNSSARDRDTSGARAAGKTTLKGTRPWRRGVRVCQKPV